MKISELVEKLQKFQKVVGDVEVILSSDSEGNGYGSIDSEMSITIHEDEVLEKSAIVIFPFEESWEIEELI